MAGILLEKKSVLAGILLEKETVLAGTFLEREIALAGILLRNETVLASTLLGREIGLAGILLGTEKVLAGRPTILEKEIILAGYSLYKKAHYCSFSSPHPQPRVMHLWLMDQVARCQSSRISFPIT